MKIVCHLRSSPTNLFFFSNIQQHNVRSKNEKFLGKERSPKQKEVNSETIIFISI